MRRARAPRCVLIVTADDVGGRPDVIAASLAAGVDALMLRDRKTAGGALLAAAAAARQLTNGAGAALLVNDRLDVALAAHADGVHLPAASFPVAHARAVVGPEVWIGCSTHAPDEAARAAADGADYVVLGPIYATPSKQRYGAPLGVEALARTRIAVPLIAIGGITADRAGEVCDAGARGVAVIRTILDAPDPATAARGLVTAIDAALGRRP